MKIYSQEYILEYLNLKKISVDRERYKSVSKSILEFYKKRGYTLVKTHLIEETKHSLKIIIDEGRLGKIVFHRLSSIKTIIMRQEFNLKHKIYNKYAVERETNRLKKKYGYKDIHIIIQPAKEFDKASFQLYKEFELPGLGKTSLPFLDKFGYANSLIVVFEPHPSSPVNKFDYGLKTSYRKGLIPYVRYYHPSFAVKKDFLEIGSSIGIRYEGLHSIDSILIDLTKFSKPNLSGFSEIPNWTFMKLYSNYHFVPTLKGYFTPLFTGLIHNSRASRIDLGLTKYKFLQMRGTLAPGITLLHRLKIYAGVGGERVYVLDPDVVDDDSEYHPKIERHVDNWGFFEIRVVDMIPWKPKRTLRKRVELVYDYYFNRDGFHKIIFESEIVFELTKYGIYIPAIEFYRIWKNPPFYHEESIPGSTFKGFMGSSYHTRKMVRSANNYRISAYRDFIYAGIFIDLAWFQGSSYDLSGNQFGVVSGVSGHFIFLDQFEFNIYYGRDYLLSERKSGNNIYIKLHKKKW
ncbi:MAG: hypothetical protein SVZ03_10055 [Spirochaetota bacterium]|nr:hypothetical protein [Spirochaetota bacterium]